MLIDRDGVVNQNREDHVKTWEEFRFLPGVHTNLARLRAAGLKLSLVTNQAIVERGIVSKDQVDEIHGKMQHDLSSSSAEFDSIHYCPHKPESNCDCRKPRTGLAIEAIEQLGIPASRSCIVGDTYSDAATGLHAGCSYAILVPSNRDPGTIDVVAKTLQSRVLRCSSLTEVVDLIAGSVETSK